MENTFYRFIYHSTVIHIFIIHNSKFEFALGQLVPSTAACFCTEKWFILLSCILMGHCLRVFRNVNMLCASAAAPSHFHFGELVFRALSQNHLQSAATPAALAATTTAASAVNNGWHFRLMLLLPISLRIYEKNKVQRKTHCTEKLFCVESKFLRNVCCGRMNGSGWMDGWGEESAFM